MAITGATPRASAASNDNGSKINFDETRKFLSGHTYAWRREGLRRQPTSEFEADTIYHVQFNEDASQCKETFASVFPADVNVDMLSFAFPGDSSQTIMSVKKFEGSGKQYVSIECDPNWEMYIHWGSLKVFSPISGKVYTAERITE